MTVIDKRETGGYVHVTSGTGRTVLDPVTPVGIASRAPPTRTRPRTLAHSGRPLSYLCPVQSNQEWCGQTTSNLNNQHGMYNTPVQCVSPSFPECHHTHTYPPIALVSARKPEARACSSPPSTVPSQAHSLRCRAASGRAPTGARSGTARALRATQRAIGPLQLAETKVRLLTPPPRRRVMM